MARRPKLLDLFCGAGGCAVGYARAGFDVTGIDHVAQPRYPFTFTQGDALEYLREHGCEYDVIHASPPCQRYSRASRQWNGDHTRHPDLLAPTRELLMRVGRPWVIENVIGAPMGFSVILCGSMFGLDLRRHRAFESSHLLMSLECRHSTQTPRFRTTDKRVKSLSRVQDVSGHIKYAGQLVAWKAAMGIDWMTARELVQAIPPAYTAFIGRQLIDAIK